jgi:glycosyltransferase involved in cell wall biosynthesis
MMSLQAWWKHETRIRELVSPLLESWRPDLVNFHTPYSLFEEILPLLEARKVPSVGMLHCAWLICPRLDLLRSPTGALCNGPSPAGCLECLYSHWDGTHLKAAVKLPWRVAKLGIYPAVKLWNRKKARENVSGLIAYSKFMKEVHEGMIPGPVRFISLGVDLTGLPPRPERPRKPVRFGFAGGFQTHKGIWNVLDVAAKLKSSGLEFELHVWGPNQEPRPVEQRDLSDRVRLRGMFDPRDKWEVFADVDVLVMATRRAEPYGRVVQEAAATGAPTIAPDIGGISEQIRDNVDGLLFRFLDVDDLERQMRRVLVEPDLIHRLSGNLGPVTDTQVAVAEVEEFYLEVLNERHATPAMHSRAVNSNAIMERAVDH